jgi:hypothetical protein
MTNADAHYTTPDGVVIIYATAAIFTLADAAAGNIILGLLGVKDIRVRASIAASTGSITARFNGE